MEPEYIFDEKLNTLFVYYDNDARDWDAKTELARAALGFPAKKIVTEICIPKTLRFQMPPYRKCKNQK